MRKAQLYGLYRRPRNAAPGTKWELVSGHQMPKERAVRFWQSILIGSALSGGELEYRLRPYRRTDQKGVGL